jgi:hypothetical protein
MTTSLYHDPDSLVTRRMDDLAGRFYVHHPGRTESVSLVAMSASIGSIDDLTGGGEACVLLSLGLGEGMTLAEVHLLPIEAAELARRLLNMVVYLLAAQPKETEKSPDPQPMQLTDTHE